MENGIKPRQLPIISNTFFFIVSTVFSLALLVLERSPIQLVILLLTFISAGFLLKRKTLYIFIASIVILFLLGIKEIAENEDVSIKILKKLFIVPNDGKIDND
jgi:hypothetical protein